MWRSNMADQICMLGLPAAPANSSHPLTASVLTLGGAQCDWE